jgi:large conductance mechanosensitive channel
MKGFIEFIRKQGVVGLAIGFVIGTATAVVVGALVKDIINPLIGLVVQTKNLDALTFTVHKATFNYGNLISVIISFLVILAVVYLFFKILRLEKLDLEE